MMKKVIAFLIRWTFSTNHKDIGTLYMIFGLFAGVIGTILSIGIFLDFVHLEICLFLIGNNQVYNVIVIVWAFSIIIIIVILSLNVIIKIKICLYHILCFLFIGEHSKKTNFFSLKHLILALIAGSLGVCLFAYLAYPVDLLFLLDENWSYDQFYIYFQELHNKNMISIHYFLSLDMKQRILLLNRIYFHQAHFSITECNFWHDLMCYLVDHSTCQDEELRDFLKNYKLRKD